MDIFDIIKACLLVGGVGLIIGIFQTIITIIVGFIISIVTKVEFISILAVL